MVRYNRKWLRDKILACWLGKNIGGTIGTPYEGRQEVLDVKGFSTAPGEPLPNDDLDLQLVWLCALEKCGPYQLDASYLGEFWLSMIPPHFNEYGIGKCNMRSGLQPPMSGEFGNDLWKTSNGAWIRSEIWACLAPGYPGIARRYAVEDAMVDHGMGEGTVAEIFTATLESEAFFCDNVKELVIKGLSAIPEESRVARAVRIALDGYESGADYKEVRNRIFEDSRDIGVFQAPANVAYTVIGLLWGEGDFKSTVLHAVNCGDDTDCTAATAGAILGIMKGTKGIPEDWRAYIGDKIITCCVNGSYRRWIPESCTELTDRVMDMIPHLLYANGVNMEYTDGENELEDESDRQSKGKRGAEVLSLPPYSFRLRFNGYFEALVSYATAPAVKEGEELSVHINLSADLMHEPGWFDFRVVLPDASWEAEYLRRDLLGHKKFADSRRIEWDLKLKVGKVDLRNSVLVHIIPEGRLQEVVIPLNILCR